MSIFIDNETKVVVQGLTGEQGKFHALRNKAYGTKVVAGTRPEIIKIAPIIRKLKVEKNKFIFVYTGQHYDHQLSSQIIADLELPLPDYPSSQTHLLRRHQIPQ